MSNRKSARVKISTEAPPPKSLEVEPRLVKMTYRYFGSCNSTSPMDDVIMMLLGLYSNVCMAGTDHRNSDSRKVNMKIWSGVPL